MGMTLTEKILPWKTRQAKVSPGEAGGIYALLEKKGIIEPLQSVT